MCSFFDAIRACALRIEAGKDCLEKGIPYQARHDVHYADPGVIEPARHPGFRSDLLPGAILEKLRDGADETLVQLTGERLAHLLVRGVDLHVLEQRLHVSRDHAVLGGELRVEVKAPSGRIESAVGAEEIVHAREAHLFDPYGD